MLDIVLNSFVNSLFTVKSIDCRIFSSIGYKLQKHTIGSIDTYVSEVTNTAFFGASLLLRGDEKRRPGNDAGPRVALMGKLTFRRAINADQRADYQRFIVQ